MCQLSDEIIFLLPLIQWVMHKIVIISWCITGSGNRMDNAETKMPISFNLEITALLLSVSIVKVITNECEQM